MTSDVSLPTIEDVRDAAKRLRRVALCTPVVESPALNDLVGGRVLLKLENMQRTGSFKFRGAFNRISRIPPRKRLGGVIACSSGNHAQGIAAAAQMADFSSLILMPSNAPRIKIDGTRSYGAEITFYEHGQANREEMAMQLATERGATIVPAYDDRHVIAGQGTVALEILDQAAALNAEIDILLVPCSGGGLTAGCAIVMNQKNLGTSIYTVEPEGFDDTAKSLAAGRRLGNATDAQSFCDALLISPPGELTFAINKPLLAGGLVVNDDEVADAMAFAFQHLKLVVEPGGAVGLAAILSSKLDCAGKTVAVVCSGGNVDPETFCKAVSRPLPAKWLGAPSAAT